MKVLATVAVLSATLMHSDAGDYFLPEKLVYRRGTYQDFLSEKTKALGFWYREAFLCDGKFPSKKRAGGDCDDGDSTLFNGLLCVSGESLGCEAVKNAQAPDGQWWRSPRKKDGFSRYSRNSFSRDMSMGVLLYLVETKDVQAAGKWLAWIEDNKRCILENSAVGCVIYDYTMCHNNHYFGCSITPVMWGIMREVWAYLGLPMHSMMRSKIVEISDRGLVAGTRFITPDGYQLHLAGVKSLLKRIMNVRHSQQDALNEVLLERQPDNIFFRYLTAQPHQEIYREIISTCPSEETFSGDLNQWAWERDTREAAWSSSMLWDCIFISNLLDRH
ncbi:MAG: hypothetical protein CL504_08520 [Actinobacteria bacterium]|nr:hypothetical protein [Actinomycetota bacterium]